MVNWASYPFKTIILRVRAVRTPSVKHMWASFKAALSTLSSECKGSLKGCDCKGRQAPGFSPVMGKSNLHCESAGSAYGHYYFSVGVTGMNLRYSLQAVFFFFLALSAGFYDKPSFLRCTNSSEHGEFQNRKNSSVFNFYDHSDSDLKKNKNKKRHSGLIVRADSRWNYDTSLGRRTWNLEAVSSN